MANVAKNRNDCNLASNQPRAISSTQTFTIAGGLPPSAKCRLPHESQTAARANTLSAFARRNSLKNNLLVKQRAERPDAFDFSSDRDSWCRNRFALAVPNGAG